MTIGKAEKKSSATEQLERINEDLAAARAHREQLVAAEGEARLSADTYSAWRASRDAIDVEIERLTGLAASLEEPAEQERERDADEALWERHARKAKSNPALAKRTRDDIAKVNAIMFPLLRDLAASAAENQVINASLPDDLDPLVSAEFLARGRPGLPRKEIARERVWLWTKLHGRHLIGDQDAVEDRGGGKGMLQAGVSTFPCVKALFEQTTYRSRKVPLLSTTRDTSFPSFIAFATIPSAVDLRSRTWVYPAFSSFQINSRSAALTCEEPVVLWSVGGRVDGVVLGCANAGNAIARKEATVQAANRQLICQAWMAPHNQPTFGRVVPAIGVCAPATAASYHIAISKDAAENP